MESTEFNSTDGQSISYWQSEIAPKFYPALSNDISTDVCVVGAGIAGLTTAYLLLSEGKRVIVLDDSAVGDGQTGRTSAHLASANDDRFMEIARMHGEEAAKLSWDSHSAAITRIEEIAHNEKIDCDFQRLDGYLFAVPDEKPGYLNEEYEASLKAGCAVEKVDRAPLEFNTGPALKFRSQARFSPLKYLLGLAQAVEKLGGQIYCNTRVTDVQGANLNKGEFCKTETTEKLTITSEAIVVATNTPTPINDWAGIYTKQASYRTYMLVFEIPVGSVTDALYWDTAEAYHYIRIERGVNNDLLLVGGGDHKVGQLADSSDPYGEIEQWTRERFASAGRIVSRWSGQVQEPVDGLAYIGETPHKKPNVYCITGDSGMGLTHSTLGAGIIVDLIQKRRNPYAALYSATRKPLHAVADFIQENVNAVATFKDYVSPGEASSDEDVKTGEGALVRHGLKKLAVYRDDEGKIHRFSPVCPHLGCMVHWNRMEKSWDCPCHGSRFQCTGQVVMGPSIDPLTPVDEHGKEEKS